MFPGNNNEYSSFNMTEFLMTQMCQKIIVLFNMYNLIFMKNQLKQVDTLSTF